MGIRSLSPQGLTETEAYDLLRNDRRRQVIRLLRRTGGEASVRELAERIAERETGDSPPPSNIRESVYNSLHQNHLPKLDSQDVVEYDRRRKTVRACGARDIDQYMDVVTDFGITWEAYYRTLGVVSLLVLLAVHLDVPLVSRVDPLLFVSLFLAVLAVSTLYQLRVQLLAFCVRLFER